MGVVLPFRPRAPKPEEKKYASFTVSKKAPVVTEKTFKVMTPAHGEEVQVEDVSPAGTNNVISKHLQNEALYSAYLDTLRDFKPDVFYQRTFETLHLGLPGGSVEQFPNLVVEVDYPGGWIVSYAFFGVANPEKAGVSTMFVKRPRIDVAPKLWVTVSPPVILNIMDTLGRIATLSHIEVEQDFTVRVLDVNFVEYKDTKIQILITHVVDGEIVLD